jgi:hypothetical protein
MLEIARKRILTKKPLLITNLLGSRAKELLESDRAMISSLIIYARS